MNLCENQISCVIESLLWVPPHAGSGEGWKSRGAFFSPSAPHPMLWRSAWNLGGLVHGDRMVTWS